MSNEVYNSPKSNVSMGNIPDDKIERGGCLTVYLVFMVFANAVTAATYIAMPGAIQIVSPEASQYWSYALSAGALLNTAFAILVWYWKKIGIFGFMSVAILAFVINVYIGLPMVSAVMGLVGPFLLVLLVKSKWPKFS